MSTSVTTDGILLRVEKGHATDEEIAALTAVLLARIAPAGPGRAAPRPRHRDRVVCWRCHGSGAAFRAPHSWRGSVSSCRHARGAH